MKSYFGDALNVSDDSIIAFKNLPRDLTKLTPAQFEEWARCLSKSRMTQIRKWQAVAQAQMRMAYDLYVAKRPCEFGENPTILNDIGSAAVAMKHWKDDCWKAHIPKCIRDN